MRRNPGVNSLSGLSSIDLVLGGEILAVEEPWVES